MPLPEWLFPESAEERDARSQAAWGRIVPVMRTAVTAMAKLRQPRTATRSDAVIFLAILGIRTECESLEDTVFLPECWRWTGEFIPSRVRLPSGAIAEVRTGEQDRVYELTAGPIRRRQGLRSLRFSLTRSAALAHAIKAVEA